MAINYSKNQDGTLETKNYYEIDRMTTLYGIYVLMEHKIYGDEKPSIVMHWDGILLIEIDRTWDNLLVWFCNYNQL